MAVPFSRRLREMLFLHSFMQSMRKIDEMPHARSRRDQAMQDAARLSILIRLTAPSTGPEFQSVVNPVVTASKRAAAKLPAVDTGDRRGAGTFVPSDHTFRISSYVRIADDDWPLIRGPFLEA